MSDYKITKISVSKLVNTGNYSNCQMSLEAEVSEEANIKDVTKSLTKELDTLILIATDKYKTKYDKYKELIDDKYGRYSVREIEEAQKFISNHEKGLIDKEGDYLIAEKDISNSDSIKEIKQELEYESPF